MTTAEALATTRELVAAEVRAYLGRARLNSNNLPELIGNSQSYWFRRINGDHPFDMDDLAKLSELLNVPMSAFVPDITPDTNDPDWSPLSYSKRRPPLYIVGGSEDPTGLVDAEWPAEQPKEKAA
jgi:hypothetical protein